MATPRRTLITIPAAAEHLGCAPRTIRRYIAQGRLSGYRAGPRLIRVDLNELEQMLRPIPAGGEAA